MPAVYNKLERHAGMTASWACLHVRAHGKVKLAEDERNSNLPREGLTSLADIANMSTALMSQVAAGCGLSCRLESSQLYSEPATCRSLNV